MSFNYLEILDRSYNGEYISENDWDLRKVAMTTNKLVKKCALTWNRDIIIPDDPALADRIFEAGFELAAEVGVYNRSTGRILKFDRLELEQGLAEMKPTLVMGEGKDARTLFARKVMDDRPPLVWAGSPGTPYNEELFLQSAISWAQEPIVDLLTCGSLAEVYGREVRTADPIEIVATRRELKLLHDALYYVGRPGMGMLAAQSSVSELGDLSVANPNYLRPTDSHLVPMLNELKLDNRNISRAVNSIEYGMRNAGLYCVLVGGLGGDAPGSAVVTVASFILGNLTNKSDYQLLHPIHLRHIATSTREVMWVEGIVEQAFARNAPCIIVTDIYPKSGALTEELLYETAANAIAVTVNGGHLEGVGSADGLVPNATGLEARFMGEVGHAVTKQGMDLKEANEIVVKLLAKYEHVFNNPEEYRGARFDQAYDMQKVQPLPEWSGMYEKVKSEVKRMGLSLL